jgi:hypothetical protein
MTSWHGENAVLDDEMVELSGLASAEAEVARPQNGCRSRFARARAAAPNRFLTERRPDGRIKSVVTAESNGG